MAEPPIKTGHLVVRYYAPWRRRVWLSLAAVATVLVVYGTYEWGRYDGNYSVLAALQERREHQAEMATLRDENARLRGQITTATTARSIDHQSYADVEKTLGELQAQVQRQREELAFYRGIVSPEDGQGGLRIQRLEVLSAAAPGHYKLRLVLMQSMRQDSVVSGAVKIELEGAQDKQPIRLGLTQLGVARETGDLPFSFRYFQNIEQELVLPQGFEPSAIDVEVRTSRQQPLQQSFPWSARAPG